MALEPVRHPQKDFFILDIADVMPKDDTASMEHPIFSLATKPDHRHLEYQSAGGKLKIIPSGLGLPTIKDKDILIFCISQLMHRKNQGKPIGKSVRFSARSLLTATNRPVDGDSYSRLEQAFQRLVGTTFTTNIRTGGKIHTEVFSLVNRGGFVRTADERFRLDYCEVELSDWFMNAIEANEVVTISNDYFRLRRPLERRLYEIARKFCGNQPRWQISLENLQAKTGSNAPLKRFRFNLLEIIKEDHTPFYRMELTDNDLVIVRPRTQKVEVAPSLKVTRKAEDQCRKIAIEKGWDFYALKDNWSIFVQRKMKEGEPPESADASMISYFKKAEKQR